MVGSARASPRIVGEEKSEAALGGATPRWGSRTAAWASLCDATATASDRRLPHASLKLRTRTRCGASSSSSWRPPRWASKSVSACSSSRQWKDEAGGATCDGDGAVRGWHVAPWHIEEKEARRRHAGRHKHHDTHASRPAPCREKPKAESRKPKAESGPPAGCDAMTTSQAKRSKLRRCAFLRHPPRQLCSTWRSREPPHEQGQDPRGFKGEGTWGWERGRLVRSLIGADRGRHMGRHESRVRRCQVESQQQAQRQQAA